MLSLPALVLAPVTAIAATTGSQPATVKSGVERWRAGDYPAAVVAWLPYAAQGDADAAFNLGQAYKLGRGVNKDPAVARDYYRRAATKGHLPAQANLGIALFQAGDKLEAVRWLKQAADRGEQRAQYVLGIAAYNGDGTPKNTGLAYGYLLRAQASGLPQATTALASIEPSLTPDARAAGQAMADSLAAGNGVPPALAAASTPRSGPAGVQRPGSATPAPTGIVANAVSSVRSALGLAPAVPVKAPTPRTPVPPVDSASAARPRATDLAATRPAAPVPAPAAVSRPPAPKPAVVATPTPRPATEVAAAAVEPPAAATAVGPVNPNPPVTVASVDVPAARPVPATAPPPKPVATDAVPVAKAAVAAAPPPKPAEPKPLTWRVQLGAFSSQKQADSAWASVKTSQAGAIGKAKPIFDASGPVVKFQIGPFASKDAARDACARLAFAGKACFVTQG